MALKIEPWDIVLIDFPFTDGTTTKVRPGLVTAVVLNDVGNEDVIIIAISSQKTGFLKGVEIKDSHPAFKKSGLKKTSRILPGKIFTCAKSEISKKLGKLDVVIQEELKIKLRSILNL